MGISKANTLKSSNNGFVDLTPIYDKRKREKAMKIENYKRRFSDKLTNKVFVLTDNIQFKEDIHCGKKKVTFNELKKLST